MFKLVGNARAALMGILFAMVGFSYALATSAGVSAAIANASGRAAVLGGTSLHFTNPKIADASGDFDLGDAVAGSLFTARYCRAAGGLPPYAFTSPLSATNPLSKVRSELSLLLTGKVLVGTGGPLSNVAGPIKFAVHVTDGLSGSNEFADGQFRITLVSGNLFKFGISSLGNAAAGHSYNDQLVVVNGSRLNAASLAGITYSVDTVVGPNGNTLESNGLTLNAFDGSIFGKPISAGTITFVAHATDQQSMKAVSRDGSREGQPLSIVVDPSSLNSDIVATSIKIQAGSGLDRNGVGKDSIAFKGFVNLQGQSISSFSGRSAILKISNYTSPTVTFSSKGIAATAKGVTPAVVFKIGTKGALTITIKKEIIPGTASTDVVQKLGVPSIGGLLGVSISIVDPTNASIQPILSADILTFNSKTARNGSFTLTFSLGGRGGQNKAPAGNFLLTSVVGSDAKGLVADSWKIGFIATPAKGTTLQSGSVFVSIGTFTDPTAITLSGKGSGKGGGSKDPRVSKISLSDAGNGSLTTGPLPGKNAGGVVTGPNTGIPTAATASTATVSVDISITNGGVVVDLADSVAVASARNKWSSVVGK